MPKKIDDVTIETVVVEQGTGINPEPKIEEVKTPDIVFAKCRRGRDGFTNGQSCPSMKAYRMTPMGSHVVQFKCVQCSFVWNIPLQTSNIG